MRAAPKPHNADQSNLNAPQTLAALSVNPGSRVLEIGCKDGSAARPLAERGCQVVAVAFTPHDAQSARNYCERVIVGDIEGIETQGQLVGEVFDAIVMLDLLGYVRDPLALLVTTRTLLKSGGRFVVSFSNITHGAVRLSLLRGDFAYSEVGLLARARLRFFDRRAAEALLLQADLRIDERLRVTRELEATEIPADITSLPGEVVSGLRRDCEATTYEFVFVATSGVSRGPRADASLAEQLQARVHELQNSCRALEVESAAAIADLNTKDAVIRSLEERIEHTNARACGLETELTTRLEELHIRQQEIRQLQSDVTVREAFITQFKSQASSDRTTLNAVRSELQQARAELAAFAGQVTEWDHERLSLSAQLAEVHRERESLSAQLAEVHGERTSLSAQLAEVHGERASLSAQVGAAQDAQAAAAELTTKVMTERDLAMQQVLDVQDQLRAAVDELEHAKRAFMQLRAYADSAGFRLVERVSVRLKRHERTYRLLQRAIRKIAFRSTVG